MIEKLKKYWAFLCKPSDTEYQKLWENSAPNPYETIEDFGKKTTISHDIKTPNNHSINTQKLDK